MAALLGFLDDEPALGKLMLVDAPAAGPRALTRREMVLARLVAAVDAGRRERDQASSSSPELPLLTAEGTVGSVLSILHTRLLASRRAPLSGLLNPLMSLIVLPYLGAAAAQRELSRSVSGSTLAPQRPSNPLNGLGMRLTYRTACVLMAIAAHPGASNREVADSAGISDRGQMSKLLHRLAALGLVLNKGQGQTSGRTNAWTLTPRGERVEQAIAMKR